MEIIEDIRQYIINNVNASIKKLSTTELPLADLTSKNIVTSEIDTDKYKFNTMVHLIDGEEVYEDYGNSTNLKLASLPLVITVLVKCGSSLEELYLKTKRYAAAVIACLIVDPTLGGKVSPIRVNSANYAYRVEGADGYNCIDINLEFEYVKNLKV